MASANGQGRNSNGWTWFDCWTKRVFAILALLAILASSIYAYADLRNTNTMQDEHIANIERVQNERTQLLTDMDRKITRLLALSEATGRDGQ